jgi:hypothetical protein
VKDVTKESHSEKEYFQNDYEVDQVVSKFVSAYRKKKRTYLSYETLIKDIYKEFFQSNSNNKDAIFYAITDEKFKKKIIARLVKEGINYDELIRKNTGTRGIGLRTTS